MTTPNIRAAHPYYMHDAILAQPDAIAAVIAGQRERCAEIGDRLAGKRRIYIVGIGTSWHAAIAAAAVMNMDGGTAAGPGAAPDYSGSNGMGSGDAGPECFAANSFEFCSAPPLVTPDDAVIVISHRGTKRSSYEALDIAIARGAYTVAITSTDPGPRILAADAGIRTVAQERSAAFTVSYATALTALAMLDCAIDGRLDAGDNGLDTLPGQVAGILAAEDDIKDVVAAHSGRRRFISAGWGANRANAYEVALKIKETSRADCEGFQIEQLLHGPFCALDSDCLLTLIAPAGDDRGRAGDLARAANALGSPVWALTNRSDGELDAAGARLFPLPSCPPALMPIASVVPLQLFTYHLALARGKHPDLFQQDDPLQAAARVHYDL